MFIKILVVAIVLLILVGLFFPKLLPAILGRVGRATGGAARLGREVATGDENASSELLKYEVQAGEALLTKTLIETPLCRDARLQSTVDAIGRRLATHARREHVPWRFSVVESDEPNAFALPGGAVLVTRPLVEMTARDPDQLAGVLGHEIQHIDRRHALRQMGAKFAARTGTQLLRFGGGLILSKLTSGAQDLLVNGYRQDNELEADLEGARLAQRAGYDPAGLERLLSRFLLETPESGPAWQLLAYLRAHPPLPERIARLRQAFGAG